MDHEAEIKALKAALSEHKLAVVGLATCLAQTLAASDPRFRSSLTTTLRNWAGQLEHRGQWEALEIALMFGQAFVDPAFPMSSEPPKDG